MDASDRSDGMVGQALTGESGPRGAFSETISFPDNRLAAILFGELDVHLRLVEEAFGVVIQPRGNRLTLTAGRDSLERARRFLEEMYALLERGGAIDRQRMEDGIRLIAQNGRPLEVFGKEYVLTGGRRPLHPRGVRQAEYVRLLKERELTFAVGPAGTGKTFLGVAAGVAHFLENRVSRLVFTRPAVEAGERLGFLPGDLQAKVDPYLRPLYDALFEILGPDKVSKMMERGNLEIAPLAYMRGRTLSDAFVILDEAQNTTSEQMKMFLTRFGIGSRVVVCGDITQVDLPKGQVSGLVEAIALLEGVAEIGLVRFGEEDVVRHPLVRKIVAAYRKGLEQKGEGEAP